MNRNSSVRFGLIAALVFGLGIGILPLLIPGYDPVRQTVSEIGEIGSPMRWPFAFLLFSVSALVLVFAFGLRSVAAEIHRSAAAAYLAAFMAVSASGVGYFAYPHPLHNAFGISELIAYQAPLVLALTWRGEPQVRSVVIFSWTACALVYFAIGLNLATFDRQGLVWTLERPVYGLIQRLLFATWFVWCAGVSLLLSSRAAAQSKTG